MKYTIILLVLVCAMSSELVKLEPPGPGKVLLQCIQVPEEEISSLLKYLKENSQVREELKKFDVSDWGTLLEKGWKNPGNTHAHYHITLVFCGRGGRPISPFEDGVSVIFHVVGIAIDHRTIALSVTLPDKFKGLCQNDSSHITLYIGKGSAAVASNAVLADAKEGKTFFFPFPEPIPMTGHTETQYATCKATVAKVQGKPSGEPKAQKPQKQREPQTRSEPLTPTLETVIAHVSQVAIGSSIAPEPETQIVLGPSIAPGPETQIVLEPSNAPVLE